MNSQDFINLEDQYGAHNYKPLDVVLTKGKGVWVEVVEGNRYLDCLSAYSALNQGHCHPRIVQAMTDQLQRISLTSRAFRNDKLGLFYKKLSDMTGYDMSLPMNSGAEAVETAIKVARKWGYAVKGIPKYEAEIIVAAGNFHGRTVTCIVLHRTPVQGRVRAIHARLQGYSVRGPGRAGSRYRPQHRRGDAGTHPG